MNLKTMLLVNAIVAGVFGVAFLFVPEQLAAIYGVSGEPSLPYMGQLLGLNLFGIGVLCWFAKDAPASKTRTAIVRALFIVNGLGFVVSLMAQLRGVQNTIGWSTVAIYLLLALGWTYFLREDAAA
jgi:hypothetical protein